MRNMFEFRYNRGAWHNLPAMLADGTPAPDFQLPDQDGNPVALEDFRGKWLVFWWFPKAATAG